ncbi:TIR domain-containing protein [Bacillus infantis]|uniref:TIR domain-containing protein n=1 Tax=Bacillus infantis TaxID=324767 RepID=UPI003CE75B82
MTKAFLSHNNADKVFVEKVAKKLDRTNAVFDNFIFYEGEDFRDSIQKGLDQSSLFVLFASKKSLKAPWVNYELNDAELLLIEGRIKKVLVFLIGDNVAHSDLPKWCQKALVVKVSNPSITARLIEEKLLQINTTHQDVYVGRGLDKDKFSEHLFRKTKSTPQVLVFYGLQGIGRRTFARDILMSVYNLRLGPIFELDSAEHLVDLYVKVLDDIGEIKTKKDLSEHIGVFQQITLEEKTDELIRLFQEYSQYKIAPCILDNGSLLDLNGQYRPEFRMLMEKINKVANLYLVILQTRNPYYLEEEQFFFVTYLKPLSNDGMNSLLSTYLRNMKIDFEKEEIMEFTRFLDGYAPAAQFVRNTIEKYGMEIALADKTLLNDFKARSFTQYLKQMVQENPIKINILRICEAFPPLSLSVLKLLNDDENFMHYFKELIDQSIIVVEKQNNKYTLSSPLKEAVRRTWGSLNKSAFKEISINLKNTYWNEEDLPENAILETLIFCLLRSEDNKDLKEFSGIILPSTILKAAKSAYENREWYTAIDLSKKALELNTNLDQARVILFKSLVRENENSDYVLSELKLRDYRGYFALKGFRDLKRKNYNEAIKSYRLAIANGDESVVVYREIAECYYWLNDYENATKHISTIVERNKRPNPFALDLAAKISIESKDFEKANEHIATLELVDRPENVSHRKASLYSKQGNYEEAIKFAEEACKRQPPLPETFLNKAYILIMLEKYDEAQAVLEDIRIKFKAQSKKDFFNELKCKLSIETSGWEEAEVYFNKLSNQNSDYAKVLKFKIIEKKIADTKIGLLERQQLKIELERLKEQGIKELIDNDFSIKD